MCFTVADYAQCQRKFAQTLIDFKFETIGSQQTDEEIIISKSLSLCAECVQNVYRMCTECEQLLLEYCDCVFPPFKMLSNIPK